MQGQPRHAQIVMLAMCVHREVLSLTLPQTFAPSVPTVNQAPHRKLLVQPENMATMSDWLLRPTAQNVLRDTTVWRALLEYQPLISFVLEDITALLAQGTIRIVLAQLVRLFDIKKHLCNERSS